MLTGWGSVEGCQCADEGRNEQLRNYRQNETKKAHDSTLMCTKAMMSMLTHWGFEKIGDFYSPLKSSEYKNMNSKN